MSSTHPHTAIYRQKPSTKCCSPSQPARKPVPALLLALACSLGASLLVSCSDERASSSGATRLPDAATTRPDGAPTPQGAPSGVSSPVKEGSWYRVIAETAYFFDSPEQSKPNGKYLLRGDVIHAEEEMNEFVKTRFKTPNGATVVGWLKTQELGKLAANPAARSAPSTSTRVDRTPASSPPDTYSYESKEVPSEPTQPAAPATSRSRTAVVQVSKSYFYNSPDLSTPRKAHCVQGDKVRLGEERGDAVYVTFTNWEKVTSTGWMRKDALRYTP